MKLRILGVFNSSSTSSEPITRSHIAETMAEKVDDMPARTSECEEVAAQKDGIPSEFYIDPVEERALVRKIDRTIMPVMAIVYFFQCTCTPFPYNLFLV